MQKQDVKTVQMRRQEKRFTPSFLFRMTGIKEEYSFCSGLYLKALGMSTSTLHTTWVTRFFVLIYLLISVSTANASFWCQDSGGSSHLETNPVGECWDAPEKNEIQCCEVATGSGVFLSVPGDDCFDSPVHSSVVTSANRTSPLSKITATDLAPINLQHISAKSSGATRFSDLPLASDLPLPQILTALRTVILLQ